MTTPKSLLYYRGRVALYHILKLHGVGPGDEVLLQAFTCVAVPEAIMAVGAVPVWVDLAVQSVNLSVSDLESKITPRTKAAIVQHTFGIPAELDAILSVLTPGGIPMIEDCCHGFVSTIGGRSIGSQGQAAFCSFEWGKPVIAGVGGKATFNDPLMRDRAKSDYVGSFQPPPLKKSVMIGAQFYMHAVLYGPWRYWSVRQAFHLFSRFGVGESNYNPVSPDGNIATDFGWQMARFSRSRLPAAESKAEDFLSRRIQQSRVYLEALRLIPSVQLSIVPPAANAVYSRLPFFTAKKGEVLREAERANLEVAGWYSTPVHPLSGDELHRVRYRPGSCPRAESASCTLVSLPIHRKVTADFQSQVLNLIAKHA